jgi:hypothetical protein
VLQLSPGRMQQWPGLSVGHRRTGVLAIAAMAAFDLLYLNGKYLHALSAMLMHLVQQQVRFRELEAARCRPSTCTNTGPEFQGVTVSLPSRLSNGPRQGTLVQAKAQQ